MHNGNGLPQWFAGYENFRILNGDHHLADGLEILTLPGHSPGLQGLLVDTREAAGRRASGLLFHCQPNVTGPVTHWAKQDKSRGWGGVLHPQRKGRVGGRRQ